MRSVQLGLMSLLTLCSKQLLVRNDTVVTQSLAYKGKEGEPFRLAYGSCYGLVNFYTDIFRSVNEYQPHVWVWLGDAAYTDDIMGSCKHSLIQNAQGRVTTRCRQITSSSSTRKHLMTRVSDRLIKTYESRLI